jgi:prepilin-type N-terminal cleavage/methylation domain-containing protein
MKKGFTLVETILTIFIFSLMMAAVTFFARNIFYLNNIASNTLSVEFETRKVLKPMANEIRSASPSSLGAYPLETLATSTFTFYSDLDGNGVKEKVRYFLSNGSLKKGVIIPTGSPLTYNSASEVITTVVHDVRNTATTSVFQYYDTDYDGTTAPLPSPVAISVVRLVKVSLVVDADPGRPLREKTVTTQVSLRNLKDNL